MATKPTEQPEIWASADLYSSGPKAGQPTKATSESGAAPEGHKPGPTEPTTANEFNVFENKMSLLSRWTFEGRFDKAADAHPVETDVNGLLSARAAAFGDPTQPGPSLEVISSSTDWTQKIDVTDADGLRILGIYGPGIEEQLVLVNTSMDNSSQFPAVRIIGSSLPSCGGLEVGMAASGVYDNQDLRSAINVQNQGGTGVQIRTEATVLPALRVINRTDDGTSARFGHGNLEAVDKNLDGTGIDCRGGDADGGSLKSNAGPGGLFQGGAFTTSGTPKFAGHGVIALSGSTDAAIPGGAAVFAQTVGPRGVAVEASHNDSGATLPVITATTGDNAADGVEVVCVGTGVGVDVFAEGQSGVRITMDVNGGGSIGEAVLMQLQTQEPDSPGAGSLWAEQKTGIPAMRMGILGAAGFEGTDYGYVKRTTQAPCYARTPFISSFVMTGTTTVDQVISGDFTFQAGLLPQQASVVRITLWGRVAQHNASTTTATFEVRDKTEIGDPAVLSVEIASHDNAEAGSDKQSCTYSQIYTLPAAGARTFDLVWSGTVGAASGDFRGWVEIQEIGGA